MNIPLAGRIVLYAIIVPHTLVVLFLWWAQLRIFRGGAFKNPDGSSDDWHEQKLFYGIALADLTAAVPVTLVGFVFILLGWRLGYFLMALSAFWGVWANIMTTATSVRFENPRQNLPLWLLSYPFCFLLGLAYIVWSLWYFPQLFGSLR